MNVHPLQQCLSIFHAFSCVSLDPSVSQCLSVFLSMFFFFLPQSDVHFSPFMIATHHNSYPYYYNLEQGAPDGHAPRRCALVAPQSRGVRLWCVSRNSLMIDTCSIASRESTRNTQGNCESAKDNRAYLLFTRFERAVLI